MAHSYRNLATTLQALGVEDEARNAKGEWTSGGGSVGSSHVDSGKMGIATFHGTTDEVLQKIMREGITVQRDKTYAGDSVYYGDRGESVFVTTSADAAANWAEIRAHSATPELQKYYPPRGGPVVLELSVPREEWKTFKVDTEAGTRDPQRATNFYGAKIRPEWIKGVFDVKSGGGSTYNPTLVPHKMSADEDMVSAWVVLFSDGSSTKKASAGRHSYRHLDRTLSELADQHERPFLRLVPQPLAPHQNPSDAPRFETDPVEAKRVAKILASLFALAAMGEPISQATRDKLGITTEDLTAIADKVGKARAAEIMGMKWDGEDLVPDPSADKAITQTTESQVNDTVDAAVATALEPGDTWAPGEGPNDTPAADTGLSDDEELALAIAALFAFSSLRPDVVADYETANAQNMMALTAYAAAGVTQVLVLDGEEFDDPCREANGATWSIEQAMSNPLQHSFCQRSFLPLGADGMQLAAKRSRQIAPLPFTPTIQEGS